MEITCLCPPWLSGSYHRRSILLLTLTTMLKLELPAINVLSKVALGLGRIVALHYRSSAPYQIPQHNRCLYF